MEGFSDNRKLARIAISSGLLKDLITIGRGISGHFECVKGVPEDAVFICSRFNESDQVTYLIFYHQSFDDVPVGCDIPIIDVVHK